MDARPLVYGYRLELIGVPDGTEHTAPVDFTAAIDRLASGEGLALSVSLRTLGRLIDEHEAARAVRLALRDEGAAA